MASPPDNIVMRTQSPVSTTSTDQAAIRGITNAVGSNNCFLNCAVQALWNLDAFRTSFVLIDKHNCSESACIFCALLILAANYQYHDQGPVTPDILRSALAEAYQDKNRFQIGFMDDAAECFEGILYNLHVSLSGTNPDFCVSDQCISHRLFSMTLIEQTKCLCGATSEPLTFDQYVFYVSVSSVIESFQDDKSLTFANVMQLATNSTRICPADDDADKCSGPASLNVSMIEKPDVFCVGFAWPNTEIETDLIKSLMNCIENELDLDELFHNVAAKKNNLYKLVGIMVYYGHHYFTFFFHSGIKKWVLYDDASVREIGPNWSDVKSTLIKGKYQPLVLLYANPKPEKTFVPNKETAELSKTYKGLDKIHKGKNKNKHLMACLAPASPIESRQKRNRHELRQQSYDTTHDLSPGFSGDHQKTFLDSMFTGVEERFADGLSFLGLKDGDKLSKKRYINDCMKQADSQYFEASKHLITKDYTKALDFAIDASNFYNYIMSHDDASISQRELAKIKYETSRIKSRRISRRISRSQLSPSQLSALYHRCPLCENFREDHMQYCHDCTKYCKSCQIILDLSETEYCSVCMPQYVVNATFEQNLTKSGHQPTEVVWYDTKYASPPPYETLPKTKCMLCKRSMVTTGTICNLCK